MRNNFLIYSICLSLSFSLHAETPLSEKIFHRFTTLRAALLRNDTQKDIDSLLPDSEYLLTKEEKRFASKFILFRKPDSTLTLTYKDEVIEWNAEGKKLKIDFKNIHQGTLVIGKEIIKLDINLGDNFKTAFKNNLFKIKSAVGKEYIAQLKLTDILLMAVVFPFSFVSGCSETQSNDAELLSLAGWSEVKTAESPNYLYAQDRPGNKRAYLNAQTDQQAIKAGHATNYYLNRYGTVAHGQLVPSGRTVVVPRNTYSENPNLIDVMKQKLR